MMSLNSGRVGVTGDGSSLGMRGEFNDTVFEVLGAENSKNDVVELWRGWGSRGTGAHERRGGSSTTLFLRFWGLKTPKTMSLRRGHGPNGESIWLRGVIASTSFRGLMVKASALECKVAGSIPAGVNGVNGVQRHRF